MHTLSLILAISGGFIGLSLSLYGVVAALNRIASALEKR